MKAVKDLVPGDPEAIWLLADSYSRMATTCEDVGRAFRTTDVGPWYGAAAEAFHARFEQQPRRLTALADGYLQAAVALDTYAAVLAWAQRQAGEVIALEDKEEPPADPVLTVAQQAELAGVITSVGEPEPRPVDQRAAALDTYRRALAMLDTVGDESAAALRTAAASMPEPAPKLPAPTPPLVRAVVPARTWFDPAALRDDPHDWAVAIKAIRKRLRWDGLNRLSPRLAQHIFEGHHRRSRTSDTGYHHRERGVDQGALRVVKVVEGPDEHGVYVARIRGPRTPPTVVKTSTFFPDDWSRAEVLCAVRQVFLDAMRNGDYEPAKRRFRGVYKGVRIEGFLRQGAARPRLCDIVTAYPRGVRKRRHR